MTTIDVVFWTGLLLVGVALALSYGASWRRVARAIAEAERTSMPDMDSPAPRPGVAWGPRSPSVAHTSPDRLLYEQAAR